MNWRELAQLTPGDDLVVELAGHEVIGTYLGRREAWIGARTWFLVRLGDDTLRAISPEAVKQVLR